MAQKTNQLKNMLVKVSSQNPHKIGYNLNTETLFVK